MPHRLRRVRRPRPTFVFRQFDSFGDGTDGVGFERSVEAAAVERVAFGGDGEGRGDVGAVFGLGFPPQRGGPFRYVDQRGAGAVAGRLEEFAARCGERFKPAELLSEMGRSGQRFYGE